ncbi:MAG: hypothetical protein AOY29_06620 [Alcanivorax borkumensis]|nr:MAG: hypothetical protein AOY29_06620 [Alcanivorax borkumensis]
MHFIPFHYGCEAIFTPTATKVSRPDVPPFIKLATTTHYNFAISSRFEGIRTTVRPCHIHILTAYRPATGINLVIILPGINVMLTVETIFIAVSILIQANKTSALIKDLLERAISIEGKKRSTSVMFQVSSTSLIQFDDSTREKKLVG